MAEQLAYGETGTGDPIVFLHGITANRHHWDPVVERLAASHRCVNVDLLGHGASPDADAVDLLAQVGAVLALVGELGLESPALVGHSYGGFVATFAATAAPVRCVVNVDQPFDTTGFRSLLLALEPRLRSDEDFDDVMDDFMSTQGLGCVPDERQELLRANLRPRQEVVLGVWGGVLEASPGEHSAQVEAALPAVAAPYLGLFGGPLSDEERRLQALIPDSTVEVWEGHGHFLQLVDPDRTAARIATFVSALT